MEGRFWMRMDASVAVSGPFKKNNFLQNPHRLHAVISDTLVNDSGWLALKKLIMANSQRQITFNNQHD